VSRRANVLSGTFFRPVAARFLIVFLDILGRLSPLSDKDVQNMKTLLKQFALLLCTLSLTSAAWAQGPSPTARFDGGYFSPGGSGPISKVEANVDYGDIWGTVFLRGVDNYEFLYFYADVDRVGNITGGVFYSENETDRSYYGRGGGTFTGRISGNAMVLTFKARQGIVTVVLIKSGGYAPPFLAGRIVYFEPGKGYVELYFDEKKVWVEPGGVLPIPYTYTRTGPNTGTVSISGVGTFRVTFTDRWNGNISGSGLNTSFESWDYSDN